MTSPNNSWGLDVEKRIQTLLVEHDPRLKEELSKGYFYRANPLFYNKVHMRETLVFLLNREVPKNARILDYATGTAQFLLYLRYFGFSNLHGWEQNKRWIDAGTWLFKNLADLESVEFKVVPRPVIYDILSEAQQPFDVITMFGLIYGHGIDVLATLMSVSNALANNGIFVANDKTYNAQQMLGWIESANMKLARKITIENANGLENYIYFCIKQK